MVDFLKYILWMVTITYIVTLARASTASIGRRSKYGNIPNNHEYNLAWDIFSCGSCNCSNNIVFTLSAKTSSWQHFLTENISFVISLSKNLYFYIFVCQIIFYYFFITMLGWRLHLPQREQKEWMVLTPLFAGLQVFKK